MKTWRLLVDDRFYESETLSNEAIKELMQRSNARSMLHFLIQYTLLVGSAVTVVVYYHHSAWLWGPALFVFAAMTMGMFALGHETIHRTAFQSRALNDGVCWLVTAPIYYTPTNFRQFHFAHHRYTHDPERDPEISVGGKPAPGVTSNWFIYLGFLSGLPLLFYKIGLLVIAAIGHSSGWNNFLNYVSKRHRRQVSWEARGVLLLHTVWITAGVLWLPGLLVLLWGQVLGHAMLAFYITTEHNGLPHEGSILNRTRTTLTHPLMKFLMWNMPYHTEHHAYPAIPWHALPQLHKLMKDELLHTSPGYPNFHGKVIGQLVQGKAFQESETPSLQQLE